MKKQQPKKRTAITYLKRAIQLGIVCTLLIAAANILMISAVSNRLAQTPDELPKVVASQPDCILVLGAGVGSGGQLSWVLKDRLDTALRALEQYPGCKVLVTGDHGRKNYDEVNAMRGYLEENGVSTDDIFMDHAGFNTYDSMYRARDIFKVTAPIIVTQEFHLSRAVYLAQAMGLNASGLSADLHEYPGQLRFSLREVPARAKDLLQVHITRPEPKYLGAQIPIGSSDGRATHD